MTRARAMFSGVKAIEERAQLLEERCNLIESRMENEGAYRTLCLEARDAFNKAAELRALARYKRMPLRRRLLVHMSRAIESARKEVDRSRYTRDGNPFDLELKRLQTYVSVAVKTPDAETFKNRGAR